MKSSMLWRRCCRRYNLCFPSRIPPTIIKPSLRIFTTIVAAGGISSRRWLMAQKRKMEFNSEQSEGRFTATLRVTKSHNQILRTLIGEIGMLILLLFVSLLSDFVVQKERFIIQIADAATPLADHCYYHNEEKTQREYDLYNVKSNDDEDNDYNDDLDSNGKRHFGTRRHACVYKAQPVPIDMDFLRDVNQFFGLSEPGDDEVSVYAPIQTRGIVKAESELHKPPAEAEQPHEPPDLGNKTKPSLAFLFDERDGTVGVVSFQPQKNKHQKFSPTRLDRRRTRRVRPKFLSLPTALQFALKLHGKHFVIDVERVPLVSPLFDVDFLFGPGGVTENYQVDTAQYYDCHYRGKIYEIPEKSTEARMAKRADYRHRKRGRTKRPPAFDFDHRRSGTVVGVAAVSHCPVIIEHQHSRKIRSRLKSKLGTGDTAESYVAPQMNALHALLKFDASSDRYVIEPLHVYIQHRIEKAQFDADAAGESATGAVEKTEKFAANSFASAKIFTSSTADNMAHSAAAHKTKQVAHEIGQSQAVKSSEKFATGTYAGARRLAHQAAQTQAAQSTGQFATQVWHGTKKDASIVGSYVSKKAVDAKHYVADRDDTTDQKPSSNIVKQKKKFRQRLQNPIANQRRKNLDQLSVVHKLFHSADGIDMPGVVFDTASADAIEFQRPQQINSPTPKEQPEVEEVEQFAPSTATTAAAHVEPINTKKAAAQHPFFHKTEFETQTKVEPSPFWLKLAAFVDFEMYTRIAQLYKTKQEKVNLILGTFNAVQMLYSDGTLHEIQPHLVLRTLKWSASADRNLPTHGNVVDYMAAFCTTYQPDFLRDFSNGQQVWDLAVVLTGLDVWGAASDVTKDPAYRGLKSSDQKMFAVTGVAYTGGVCTPGKNCAVIEYMKLMSASDTIAHEVGHSLSMKHDGSDNDCDRYAGRIMGRSEHAKERFGWSKCSYASLKSFLDKGKSECLHTPPPISKDRLIP